MFHESYSGEISQFMSYYGLELVGKDHYYTFPGLLNAPEYSIKGASILGNVGIETFSGKPWEVMERNGLVFDLVTGLVRSINSITSEFEFFQNNFYYVSQGLINPGSIDLTGQKIKSYRAQLIQGTWSYRYSEVEFV